MKRLMPSDEQLEILVSVEDYHKIFYIFWELASVYLSDEIPTACVTLPKNAKPDMIIGEEFWKVLNLRERLFVVCHECLHIFLDHGVRNDLSVPGATPSLVNKAQDICINEMIVDMFNYDREDLRDWKKFCWIETCFSDPHLIKRNETFIYYLKKLIEDPSKAEAKDGPTIFDEHGLPSDGTEGEPETQEEKKAREKLAETLAGELTVGELEKLIKGLPGTGEIAGTMAGVIEQVIAKKSKKLKINFAHIIRKLKKSSMKKTEHDVETFTHEDRRFEDIIRTQGVSIPGMATIEKLKSDRLLTAVFMDISGSCMDYFDIFQRVFLAFDVEREIFDTHLFIFDTKVKEVKPGDSIHVGGGTDFKIIEDKCLELEAQGKKYPDCIIVITDGFGTEVNPKAPSKWIFLLTPKNFTESLVPIKSKKFFIDQITFDKT
jgi:predicted metal-dependent peptidase